MPRKLNTGEQLVEDLSDEYVAIVLRMVESEEVSARGPWYEEDLSPDAQLWRWEGDEQKPGPRIPVLDWLMRAGVYMGWEDADEVLAHIEDVFTSPAAPDLIPPELVADPAQNEGFVILLEMVQAAGIPETANHIRKMERMHEGKMQAVALLQTDDQYQIPLAPDAPPPMPTQLAPNASLSWPLYGGIPQAADSQFNPSVPGLSGV